MWKILNRVNIQKLSYICCNKTFELKASLLIIEPFMENEINVILFWEHGLFWVVRELKDTTVKVRREDQNMKTYEETSGIQCHEKKFCFLARKQCMKS